MALYNQITYLPIIFQVEEGAINNINKYLEDKNFGFKRILVLSGSSFSSKMAAHILANNSWSHEIIKINHLSEVDRIRKVCSEGRFDLLIGVGGGKVLDTVKRVSYLSRLNHIAVPTVISNDGLISPISVLLNYMGKTESMSGQMPMGVILDLDILEKAPFKYLQAASGDILSNLSSTFDWHLACNKGFEQENDIAFQLSKMAAHALVNFRNQSFQSKEFIKQVIQGQVNSGIAMALAGTSRPCSGSEHLISHAIDYMDLSNNTLHGLQVGVISLYCLYLQDKLKEDHLNYAKNIGMPIFFHELDEKIYSKLEEVHDKSCEMRPGRYTILDEISKGQFCKKYDSFVKEYS